MNNSVVVQALEIACKYVGTGHEYDPEAKRDRDMIDKAIRLATLEHQAVELLRDLVNGSRGKTIMDVINDSRVLLTVYDKESP